MMVLGGGRPLALAVGRVELILRTVEPCWLGLVESPLASNGTVWAVFSSFAGLCFDPSRTDPGLVSCPPYDVIDAAARARYLSASAYNVVRLLLAEPDDPKYQRAATLLADWRESQILRTDPTPRLYLYSMETDGHTVHGVVGALRLEPLGERIIPHEETLARARLDRSAVLEATAANLDLIIGLSPAPGLADLLQPTGQPRIDFVAEGVRHCVTDLTQPDRIQTIEAAVAGSPLLLADGHHRYETADDYRARTEARRGSGPWDAIACFVAPTAGGLQLGPIHRLAPVFNINRIKANFEIDSAPIGIPGRAGDLVLVERSGAHLLRPRPPALATLPAPYRLAGSAVIRDLLLPLAEIDETSLAFANSLEEALVGVSATTLALLTAPLPASALDEAVLSRLRFPQKTTYFSPKPRAGLVMRAFE